VCHFRLSTQGRHAQQRQQEQLPILQLSAQDVRLHSQTPERDAIKSNFNQQKFQLLYFLLEPRLIYFASAQFALRLILHILLLIGGG
jgi:hypothetical protein